MIDAGDVVGRMFEAVAWIAEPIARRTGSCAVLALFVLLAIAWSIWFAWSR